MTTTLTASGITFNDATSQTTTGVEIPTGTLMLFQQTAAPTGWTKQTTHNDKALRVVSGTASSGGTSAFTTVFTNQTPVISGSAGATTLSTAQMPSHNHVGTRIVTTPNNSSGTGYFNYLYGSAGYDGDFGWTPSGTTQVLAQGGGGSHSHSLSATSSAITLNVQYVDLIIASKD